MLKTWPGNKYKITVLSVTIMLRSISNSLNALENSRSIISGEMRIYCDVDKF